MLTIAFAKAISPPRKGFDEPRAIWSGTVKPSASDAHPYAAAKIDYLSVKVFEPGILVPLCQTQKRLLVPKAKKKQGLSWTWRYASAAGLDNCRSLCLRLEETVQLSTDLLQGFEPTQRLSKCPVRLNLRGTPQTTERPFSGARLTCITSLEG